jgi:hypothetical protein
VLENWEISSEGTSMKRLIRNQTTRLFYKGVGQWTKEQDDALNFNNSVEAIEAARTERMKDCEILLAFKDSRFDIPLPLGKLNLLLLLSFWPDIELGCNVLAGCI